MSSPPSKKVRKSNYSAQEIEILTEDIGKHNSVLSAAFSSSITHKIKNGIWEKIADRVNAASSAHRSGADLRKKWNELKCQTRKKAMSQKRELVKTGGGPAPPPMSQVEEKVISLIPKCQVEGIVGGLETGGFENEIIQILDVPQSPLMQRGLDLVKMYLPEEGQLTASTSASRATTAAGQFTAGPRNTTEASASATPSVNQQLPIESKSEKVSRQKTTTGNEIIQIENKKLQAMREFFDDVSSKLDNIIDLQRRKLQLEEEKIKILKSTENLSTKTPSPRNIFKLLEL
ncbi:myb/SANT-like DNA-binding domain-containing protein 4 isoform X1 [Haliotis rubra]|uniref:myb/SANT-like DNA-binding domain-containing protein 4 isoform X1 n=1 Tax=Haliotis rubra TaxID=36100 RepID=UPI001EE56F04|nr:myb/SANT-like DNA-binding domain-containing protein 4 isoform X1 [Haliotis rubra]